ncbi:retroelement silencing factor 1-like [Erethizon dorsatum]
MTEEKASKPAGEKQANESMTNTSARISKPAEIPSQNPCSVERNPQNKMVNPLQEAALSVLVQNYEPSCANVTKGTELQIAVVSPLILSNVIKEITPGALPEAVYPVIKEGSICSLQNQPEGNAVVTAALKVDVMKPVVSPAASAKVFPLIQKEMQTEPSNGHSQDTPSAREEQGCRLNGSQTSSKPKDRTLVSGDLLQIENICSLVEGDVSYNSKIAKMFSSSPLEKVEPPKFSPPNQQVFSTGYQKEQVEQAAESQDYTCVQHTAFPCTAAVVRRGEAAQPAGSSAVKPGEPGLLEESDTARTPGDVGTCKGARSTPAAAAQRDIYSGDTDTSGGDPAQCPAAGESQDDHSVFCLRDQLSELLKEFPYGIEGLNPCESLVNQKKTEQVTGDQTGGEVSFDAKGPTDQIKITILSSEQMKELFPEQDEPSGADTLQPPKVDKSAEPQKEKHVTEVGSQCDPQTPTGGENPGFAGNTDKIHCCALGWLAMIYEGVPKCRCNTVEADKREAQQAPLEISSREQGQRTSSADVTVVKFDGAAHNPKMPLAAPAEKTQLPKIHGNDIKDASKSRKDSAPRRRQLPGQVPPKCKSSDKKDSSETKRGASVPVGQELTRQLSSKGDELDSSQRYKGAKLKFHEVNFQSSGKMTFSDQASQEGPPKKHMPQNLHPLNPKTGLFPNKDPYKKNGSFVQSLSPEKKKLKFKESSPQEGHLEKRKLEQGEIPGLEIKKKRYNKQEQNKNAGVTRKLCNFLSNPNERAIVREDSTLNAKSSDFKDTRERATVRDKTASQMQASDARDTRERAGIKEQAASQAQASDFKGTRERATIRDKTASQMQSSNAKDTKERATVKEQAASQTQASDAKDTRERATVKGQAASQTQALDTRERATVKERVASQTQASDAKDTRERATVKEQAASQTQASDAKDTRERATVKGQAASQTQASDAKDTRERATVKEQVASQTQASDAKDTRERATVKEQAASQTQASDVKDGACKLRKVITLQEYFQRKKQITVMAKTAKKICLENVSGNSASSGSTALCARVESGGRSDGKGGSSVETLQDSSGVCTNRGEKLKAHLPEESQTCSLSRRVEGRVDGKQPSKTKLDKTLSNISNEMPPQEKEQRKSYLNRVSFRCTEHERICLTTFSSSSWKLGKDEKSQEHNPKASLPGRDSAVKPGLLEFKLCPDVLLKSTKSVEDQSDLKAHPEEQAAAQVSGIKSSRKDWIKCTTEKKTMQESDQEIGVNSRLLQRSTSADGREMQQNLAKDSQAMFQTYKQLYLQKRGGSLGSSPSQ